MACELYCCLLPQCEALPLGLSDHIADLSVKSMACHCKGGTNPRIAVYHQQGVKKQCENK